ncbi:uncharacterized protein LOC125763010 isoform X1 [Anopheles funestus]|uniref:uncharacterized protein LOC125763010 isoform X1 n=1 Tax=Anopheles funestus TaxID=62324 RepID=UPI0020C6CA34|nr:uncharacterized protein LOC125763010 isoform X1 [Anopheles funestus]
MSMAAWCRTVRCVVLWCCGLILVCPLQAAPIEPLTVEEVNSSLDPVQWKEAIGEDVYRTKRKYRPEEWAAANAILDLLEQLKNIRNASVRRNLPPSTTTTTSTTSTTSTTTTTTTTTPPPIITPVPHIRARADRSSRQDEDEIPQFNPDGTIMLQLPGKLFGNATNFVLAAAKLFGDFLTVSFDDFTRTENFKTKLTPMSLKSRSLPEHRNTYGQIYEAIPTDCGSPFVHSNTDTESVRCR